MATGKLLINRKTTLCICN